MEAIMLHLKLIMGVQDVSLAYVVRQQVNVKNLPVYKTHLNLDEKLIARASIDYAKSNF